MRQDQAEPHAISPLARQLQHIKQNITEDARKNHLSVLELRAKYDCSAPTVRALLADQGAVAVRWQVAAAAASSSKRRQPKGVDRSPAARFFADARRGLLNRRELAAKHGLSYSVVCVYLRKANIGIPVKPLDFLWPSAVKRARRQLHMRALREQGRTLVEIADKFFLTRERVRQIIASPVRAGVDHRGCRHPLTSKFGAWRAGPNNKTREWICRACNSNRRAARG